MYLFLSCSTLSGKDGRVLKEDILGFIATRDSVEKEALGRPEPRFPGGYTQSFTQRAMEEIHERKEPIRGERNHANL